MEYPSISEYIAAIRDAADNLEELNNLQSVLDEEGEPMHSSGAFAVVFKMKDEGTGRFFALKCFLTEQEGRAEAYKMIEDEQKMVNSPYFTSVRYLEKELFVDSSCEEDEFPVLVMDWIDGETLDVYIQKHRGNQEALRNLSYRFSQMAF